jgi:cytochrome c-type biogenesis protein
MVFANVLGQAIAWIAFFVGIFFTVVGILMMFGKNLLAFHLGGNRQLRKGSKVCFVLYGILFALGSLGCALPLFAILVLSSFHAGGFGKGMWDFILYALGMGIVVTAISIGATLSQQVVMKWVRSGARWMGRLSGLITLATGIYLIAYWFPFLSN